MNSIFKLDILKISILVVVVIVFVLGIIARANEKLSGEEFLKKYNETPNAVMIDVRTPEEFAEGHIKGAINIDFESESFASEIKKLDPELTYFVYCRSGNRSGKAINMMILEDLMNTYELKGGIVAQSGSIRLVSTENSEIK
jgi:rhodanese-related sulfurtransferase